MLKTLRYIILLSSFYFVFPQALFAQQNEDQAEYEKQAAKKEAEKLLKKAMRDSLPLFSAITLELDLFEPVSSFLSKEDVFSMGASVQLILKEKYLPIFEMGVARGASNYPGKPGFNARGMFYRVGMDYNLAGLSAKGQFKKYALLGARLGMSRFSYDLTNVLMQDPYWEEEEPRDFINIKTTQFWFEPVFALRVEVTNNIFMGWTARLRFLFGKEDSARPSPWYIPGVGIKSLGGWGLNYTIGYRFDL